jgi:hypothetical protein
LAAESEANYAVAASAGQTVTVETVGDAAPVNVTIFGPGGTTWSGEEQADTDNRVMAQAAAPAHGDYLVTLTLPADGVATDYEVTFTVAPSAVARIAFPAGEILAQRSGFLPEGEGSQQFLLSGNTGWTLTADATSDGAPLSMTIEDPTGTQWIPEMQPNGSGYAIGQQLSLPAPGYYLVTLEKGARSPSTSYTMTFTLQYGD